MPSSVSTVEQTGTRSRLVSTRSPLMWSLWSWVTRMAFTAPGSTPTSPRAVRILLAEAPASTRMPSVLVPM